MSAIWHIGIADVHAGSKYAISPPSCRPPDALTPDKEELLSRKLPYHDHKELVRAYNNRLAVRNRVSTQLWNAFNAILRDLPKCDSAFIVSDNIEGTQGKSGGAELVTTDMMEQAVMAINIISKILRAAGYPKVYGARGTPYHVSGLGGVEYDDVVYTQLHNMQAFDNVLFCERGGLTWKLAHHISSSTTPYGKQTPLAKAIVENSLMVAMDKEPDADIMLFGHVHYCVGASFPMSRKQAITLPCLKMKGEQYGRRFGSGIYDVGLMLGRQEKMGAPVTWHPRRIKIAYEKPEVWK